MMVGMDSNASLLIKIEHAKKSHQIILPLDIIFSKFNSSLTIDIEEHKIGLDSKS